MANWIITRDVLAEEFGSNFNAVGRGSFGVERIDKSTLTEKFRMYDDDGVLYFEGLSDDATSQAAFAPLDDFGQPDSGCTEIRYYDKQTGQFETL